jgi:hypothetical protein
VPLQVRVEHQKAGSTGSETQHWTQTFWCVQFVLVGGNQTIDESDLASIGRMTTSRSDFIAQMTALLEQQQLDSHFDAPRPMSASEVGSKFNYDYPVLSADDLSILVDELVAMSGLEGTPTDLLSGFPLRLNAKLLDNLVYLSNVNRADETSTSEDKDTTHYDDKMKPLLTKFIIVLFTAIPSTLFNAPQATLETILMDASSIDVEEEGVSHLPIDDVSIGIPAGSWASIFVRYKHFLSFATVSLLCGPTAHDAVYTRELLMKSRTLDHLGSMLSTLGSVLAQCNSSSKGNSNSTDTRYVEFFDQCNDRLTETPPSTLAQALIQRAKFCQSHPYIYTASATTEENGIHFLSEVKTLWMHLLFLLRDLIIQYPDLCPVWLSSILYHVASDGSDTSVFTGSSSKEYPDHIECLLALLCSNIAMSLGSSTALLATQVYSSSNEAAFDHKLKAGEVAKNNARKFFRSLLNSEASNTLEKENGVLSFTLSQFVDIVSRMASHSQDNGQEACALLLDLMSLYIEPIDMFPLSDDGKAWGGRTSVLVNNLLSLQEPILQSRALAVILELWSTLVNEDSNEVLRITNMMTLLCVQNVSISSYMLRWPSIMDTLTSMVTPKSSAHAIPLCLILAIRAETSDMVLEKKQHMLSLFTTSINHVHTQLQTATATMTTASDSTNSTSISESREENAEKSAARDHQDAEVRESQAAKAGVRGIAGLSSTLHLLSAPNSGLPHALQYLSETVKKENSSMALLSLHSQLRNLNEAVMAANTTNGKTSDNNQSTGADTLRKTCKAISSYLEGARGSKAD